MRDFIYFVNLPSLFREVQQPIIKGIQFDRSVKSHLSTTQWDSTKGVPFHQSNHWPQQTHHCAHCEITILIHRQLKPRWQPLTNPHIFALHNDFAILVHVDVLVAYSFSPFTNCQVFTTLRSKIHNTSLLHLYVISVCNITHNQIPNSNIVHNAYHSVLSTLWRNSCFLLISTKTLKCTNHSLRLVLALRSGLIRTFKGVRVCIQMYSGTDWRWVNDRHEECLKRELLFRTLHA